MVDLFVERPVLEFEKEAAHQLDGGPEEWPREVLDELYQSIPEISDYKLRVFFTETDEEQGYGLGGVEVSSASTSPLADGELSSARVRKAVIPVVVKQNMLLPLDIIMLQDGSMYPLTESRLRESLFSPEGVSLLSKGDDSGDSSLYNAFYPPGRTENSFGSGTTHSGGGGISVIQGPGMKYAGVRDFPLLRSIGLSLRHNDFQKVGSTIQENPALQEHLKKESAFRTAVSLLAAFQRGPVADADALQKTATAQVPVDVAQFGRDADQYWVKTASRRYYVEPNPQYTDRYGLIQRAGTKVAALVDEQGTVTVADTRNEESPLSETESSWDVVQQSGVYRVITENGKELVGWVFPNLTDFDGTEVPMAVFTNGAVASVQSQIYGSPVAQSINLPQDEYSSGDTGVFYVTGPNGVRATVPVAVVGEEAGMDGNDIIHVRALTGGEYKIILDPDLRGMIPAEDSPDVYVPASVKFLSVDDEVSAPLIEEPEGIDKLSHDLGHTSIRVFSDGLHYGMRFENLPELEKSASSQTDRDGALFTLCAAGIGPEPASSILKEAEDETQVVHGCQDVVRAEHTGNEIQKRAEAVTKIASHFRKDLIKEAAEMGDQASVDSVLSLGFINPENIRTFVGYLPYLEKALGMVTSTLLASRIGLKEVPEGAANRAMRGLDEVVQGLRGLVHQRNSRRRGPN